MGGDPGRRITVLHHGQTQQCSHCFLTASTGCKGAVNGRACSKTDQIRAKMSTYMQALKTTTGYESLKVKYMRQLSQNYPGLQGEPQLNTTLAGSMDAVYDDNDDEEREVTIGILFRGYTNMCMSGNVHHATVHVCVCVFEYLCVRAFLFVCVHMRVCVFVFAVAD